MNAIQLSFAAILALLLCVGVESSCWGEPASPDENGNFPTSCEYQGWVFESGSSFKAPAPACQECSCLMGTLSCCGYGKYAGSYQEHGCTQVMDENSCELKFVDSSNENLPCNSWKRK